MKNKFCLMLILLLGIIIFLSQSINAYEDLTKYKGVELAEKFYSKLQIRSYQIILENVNSLGDVRQIRTYYLEPNYLFEEMFVSYSKDQATKEERLKVICDGKFLYVFLRTASVDSFQYIEIDKVKEKGIELKDFFRSYSMGNLYSFSKIFKNKRVIPDSWEIIGKKEINNVECYEVRYKFRKTLDKEKEKIVEDKIFIGCEDGLPRVPSLNILSFLPYAPLTPQNFIFLPPKNVVPSDTTEIAIKSYEEMKKREAKSDEILNMPSIKPTPEKIEKKEKDNKEKFK